MAQARSSTEQLESQAGQLSGVVLAFWIENYKREATVIRVVTGDFVA